MIRLEADMIAGALRLKETKRHRVRRARRASVEQCWRPQSQISLSDEQRQAVAHVTGAEGIAAVVGIAGAGKSTMLDAARAGLDRVGQARRRRGAGWQSCRGFADDRPAFQAAP